MFIPTNNVEPRRLRDDIRQRYSKFPIGGTTAWVFYAMVNYELDYSKIKAVKCLEENREMIGQVILVSAVRNSDVVMFEVAPKYGRLWHKNLLKLDPRSSFNGFTGEREIPPGTELQIDYGNMEYSNDPDEPFVDYLTGFDRVWETSRRNGIVRNISNRRHVVVRFRTPDEVTAISDIPADHDIMTCYNELLAEMSPQYPIPFTDCIFTGNRNDFYNGIRPYGLDIDGVQQMYLSPSTTNGNGASGYVGYPAATGETINLGVTSCSLGDISLMYPFNRNSIIGSLVVPMCFLDFSMNEFIWRGADGFIRVRIPDSLPDGVYYPHIWRIMAGEVATVPFINVSNDGMKRRVYTPVGNSVPLEHFEIVLD